MAFRRCQECPKTSKMSKVSKKSRSLRNEKTSLVQQRQSFTPANTSELRSASVIIFHLLCQFSQSHGPSDELNYEVDWLYSQASVDNITWFHYIVVVKIKISTDKCYCRLFSLNRRKVLCFHWLPIDVVSCCASFDKVLESHSTSKTHTHTV